MTADGAKGKPLHGQDKYVCRETRHWEKEESGTGLGLLLNVAGDGFKSLRRTESRVLFEMPSRDLTDAQERGQDWRTVSRLCVQKDGTKSLPWKPEEWPLPSVSGTDLPHTALVSCSAHSLPLFSRLLRLLSIE